MNCFAGYARPVPRGYWAMLRFARDDRPKPLLGEGGRPIVFPTELEATQAVLQNVLKYVNGPDYRRSGVTLSAAHSEAEKLFRPVIRRAGKKAVLVEMRAGAK